jgi:hypothetical protein
LLGRAQFGGLEVLRLDLPARIGYADSISAFVPDPGPVTNRTMPNRLGLGSVPASMRSARLRPSSANAAATSGLRSTAICTALSAVSGPSRSASAAALRSASSPAAHCMSCAARSWTSPRTSSSPCSFGTCTQPATNAEASAIRAGTKAGKRV